jgi:SEFIR domain
MASEPPKVFISYSHDSPEHEKRVLELAERLRADGVDAQLDQYVAGAPYEGWPRWMLDRLE